MLQKSVPELIFDKFAEHLKKDTLFREISVELATLIRGKKCSKADLQSLLRKKINEDSKSGS